MNYEWMKDFPDVAETSPELRKIVIERFGRTLLRIPMKPENLRGKFCLASFGTGSIRQAPGAPSAHKED
jgi:hypothetical protein